MSLRWPYPTFVHDLLLFNIKIDLVHAVCVLMNEWMDLT